MTASLSNEVIIVTGASRGIGAATALELSKQGAKVVLTARSKESLENVAHTIRAEGGDAIPLPCDVSDSRLVEEVILKTLEYYGKITALINNAGVIEPIVRLENTDSTLWTQAITINLIGAYHMARAVLPHFYKQGHGVLINLSSGAAFRPLEGWSAYCVSKAGLAMLTKTIALESEGRGMMTYGFAPGLVDTDMQGQIRNSGINQISQLPRENLSSPKEVARAMVWLCVNKPQDLNGQELDIRHPELRQRIGLEVKA